MTQLHSISKTSIPAINQQGPSVFRHSHACAFQVWTRGTWRNSLASELLKLLLGSGKVSNSPWETAVPQHFADSWKLTCSQLNSELVHVSCFFFFSLSLSLVFPLNSPFFEVSLWYHYCTMNMNCTWILSTPQVYNHHHHHPSCPCSDNYHYQLPRIWGTAGLPVWLACLCVFMYVQEHTPVRARCLVLTKEQKQPSQCFLYHQYFCCCLGWLNFVFQQRLVSPSIATGFWLLVLCDSLFDLSVVSWQTSYLLVCGYIVWKHIREMSSHATLRGTRGHSHLSSLCGLILA